MRPITDRNYATVFGQTEIAITLGKNIVHYSRLLPKLRHKLRLYKRVNMATPDNTCKHTQTYTTSDKALYFLRL